MNATHILKFVFISFLIFSCHEDTELGNNSTTTPVEAKVEKTIENGRFIFSSKASLQKTMEELENNSIENVEKEFESYYASGFRSHTPLVSEHNEILQEQLSKEIMERYKNYPNPVAYRATTVTSRYEDAQFISDPLFAAVVNHNDELVVGDSIYKFTKDYGVFFAHRKDLDELVSYIDEMKNSEDRSRSYYKMEPCMMREQYGGVTRVNEKISRYVRPLERKSDYCGGGGGSGGGGSPPPVPSIPEDVKLNRIINGLPICNGKAGGNWIQGWFGKSYVCRNYFDRKHRIKTEFWDQKWFIYASAGIQVRTQRKRFWIWWRSTSDEIHLGINKIVLKYNSPEPEINSYSHPDLFKNYAKAPIYMYNRTFYTTYNKSTNWVETSISTKKYGIPFFDYDNTNILNIFIPKVPLLKNEIDIEITTGNSIYTQSNIKKLYEWGYNFLKSKAGSKKNFVVTHQKNDREIEVIYFADRFKKTNNNQIKHKFYSGYSFKLKFAYCFDCSENKFDFSVGDSGLKFRDYTHYDLDFYGMARRGGTWRGNRMIRK